MSDDKKRGLYQKYIVRRTDGKSTGECIVLEFKDPIARAGIMAFAVACREEGYQELYEDLRKKCENYAKQG